MTPFSHLWFGIKLNDGAAVQDLHNDILNNFEGDMAGEDGNGHVSIAINEEGLIFSANPLEGEFAHADFQFVHQKDGPDVLVGWGIGLTKIYGDASLHDIMKKVETKQDLAEIAMLEILTRASIDPVRLEQFIGRLDLYISPDCE